MRSDQIHRALAQGINRYEICQLTAKGVKATHITGARFEDTINQTLEYLGQHRPDPDRLHAVPKPELDVPFAPAA
ncbi:MAG: DNA-directed RNA polymerase subunit omega [Terracidiphilus sp.]|nr:DNA-directed RNA polymerase subunit omega [Terracidiphilus sp.]